MLPTTRLSRRFSLWIAAALLPLLFLRALVPVGFMASATGGSVHYTFCGGDTAGPNHHAGNTDHACPFAQSAGAAPLPLTSILPPVQILAAFAPVSFQSQALSLSGPRRTAGSRAPPPFSLA